MNRVRFALQEFQDASTSWEPGDLDDFMNFFPGGDFELINMGAKDRYEMILGTGHKRPFTFPVVLVRDISDWKFHMIH